MPENPPALGQLERLRLIVAAFRHCKQEPEYEAVASQYWYETGEEMERDAYERAVK